MPLQFTIEMLKVMTDHLRTEDRWNMPSVMRNGPDKLSKMAENRANFRNNPAFPNNDEGLKPGTLESWENKIVAARDLHQKFRVQKS
jgi:hypothetical protein